MEIKITIQDYSFNATLNETATAKAIYNSLPIKSYVNTWGNEIYFSTGVSAALETNAKTIVEIGDLAFYPPMQAFCIFFGETPASSNNKPEAAGPVSVFGQIEDINVSALKRINDGVEVLVEKELIN